jgi:hypothetical protein
LGNLYTEAVETIMERLSPSNIKGNGVVFTAILVFGGRGGDVCKPMLCSLNDPMNYPLCRSKSRI